MMSVNVDAAGATGYYAAGANVTVSGGSAAATGVYGMNAAMPTANVTVSGNAGSVNVNATNVTMSGGSAAATGVYGMNAVMPTANVTMSANTGSVNVNATMPIPPASVTVGVGVGVAAGTDYKVEFEGYGQMSLKTGNVLPPPPPPPPPAYDAAPPATFSSAAMLTEPEARQALLNYANSGLCFGKDCPVEMTIRQIISSSALEYTLETFCEGRKTKMKEKPYKGGPVDGPSFGPPPPPWSIPCSPDSMFHDHHKKIEVPHTATIRPCHDCNAMGYRTCGSCSGRGRVMCGTCNGVGRREVIEPGRGMAMEPCFSCGGDGFNRCGTCGGDGRVTCSNCDGYGKLKNYVELKVTYTNHKSNYVMESTDMPDHLVSSVPGVTIFEQTLPQVWPINNYPVANINAQSLQLIQQHNSGFPSELHLHQRHYLRAVPVTEVHYSWKEYNTRYWVYGTNRSVYAPDYPQQGCCTIL